MFHITAFVPQWPAYIPSNIDSGLEKVVQALSRLYVLLFPRPPPQSHLIHMLYLGDVVLRYRTGVRCNVSQDARILFVITVDGKEKERTETLIKVSDSSWKLHPYISVPNDGSSARLDVVIEAPESPSMSLGHVELLRNDIFVNLPWEDVLRIVSAQFDVITLEDESKFEIQANWISIPQNDGTSNTAGSSEHIHSPITSAADTIDGTHDTMLDSFIEGQALLERFRSGNDIGHLLSAVEAFDTGINLDPNGQQIERIRLQTYRRAATELFLCSPSMGADNVIYTRAAFTSMLIRTCATYYHLFDRFGDIMDLNEAISAEELLDNLTPDDHPLKSNLCGALATTLMQRFESCIPNVYRDSQLYLDPTDLDRAIPALEDGIRLKFDDNDEHLNTFLAALREVHAMRFRYCSHERGDLDMAISTAELLLNMVPDGHPKKPHHHQSLAKLLLYRFDLCISELEGTLGGHQIQAGLEPSDIDEAIATLSNAVPLHSIEDEGFRQTLVLLCLSYQKRYKCCNQEVEDVDKAICTSELLINLIPDDDPDKPHRLHVLSECLLWRFERCLPGRQARGRRRRSINLSRQA